MGGKLTPERTALRFWAKVREGDNGCWIWAGGRTSCNYGVLIVSGRRIMAHRYAYEQMVAPIPPGLVLDHLCRVPLCVNPFHVEPVTIGVNTARGISREVTVHRWKQLTQCKQGHPLSGDNVRLTARGYRVCRACHRAYARKYYVPRQRERVAA